MGGIQESYSMRKTILLCMILVPICTFVAILCIGYFSYSRSMERRTVTNLKNIVTSHRHMIESFLAERQGDLAYVAETHTLFELSSEATLSDVLARLQRKSAAFSDLGVFDETGLHIAYQGPYKLKGRVYAEEKWFKSVLQNGYYISDVFLGFRNAPHFIISVAKPDQGHTWVIRATIDTFVFNDLVESVRIGRTGEAYILNAEGVLQTKRRSGVNTLEKDLESGKFPNSGEDVQSFVLSDGGGVEYLYTTAWMKNQRWRLVVRQEKADAFSAIRSAAYMVILIIFTGSALIVGIAFYLTDRIVRRLDRLDVEKNSLNQQLIGASRLAELGEMAAGFAHEINNPLQIIKGEHTLIKMILSEFIDAGSFNDAASLAELQDSMDQIESQIVRCANITQAILKFGRQTEPNPRDICLNDLVGEVLEMVEKKARLHNISIHTNLSQEPLVITAEPSEVQQVLLNLLNNAVDAIDENPETFEGEIAINTVRDENGQIRLEIGDNGIGISNENMKKIFSPFFTTKPVGKGTGLGLSVCYGIINKLGGKMEVKSREKRGTQFIIHLPAS